MNSSEQLISQALRTASSLRSKRADGGSTTDPDDDSLPPGTPSYIKPIDPNRRVVNDLGLYSHAAEVAGKLPQAKGTPEQYKAMLLKQGVKPDEIKWSGYDTKLAGKKQVTREELKRHFENNLPALKNHEYSDDSRYSDDDDVETGAPQYSEYQLPGGTNYREHVLSLGKKKPSEEEIAERYRKITADRYPGMLPIQITQVERRRLRQMAEDDMKDQASGADFKSSHWEEPNVVLHQRLSDRRLGEIQKYALRNKISGNRSKDFDTEDEAKTHLKTLSEKLQPDLELKTVKRPSKALHLEELQSDWAQGGREKGFSSPENASKFASLEQPLTDARIKLAEHTRRLHKQVFGMPYEDYLEANREPVVRSASVPLLRAAKRADPDYEKARSEVDELEKARSAANPAGKIPHAPYVDSTSKWMDLGLKRALHEAAKGGYSKLLITPGEEQAKRYDLAKQIKGLTYTGDNRLIATDHGGSTVMNDIVHPDDLHKHIGKDVAEKLLAQKPHRYSGDIDDSTRHLHGVDLKMGGEGMKAFYDRMVPQALEKLARTHDPEAKVQLHGHALDTRHFMQRQGMGRAPWHIYERQPTGDARRVSGPHDTEEQAQKALADLSNKSDEPDLHSLDITPKMRASILRGQKAYHSGGDVE